MFDIKIKELIRSGLIYGIGLGLNSLISFLLIPIYTSYFTQSEFGIFSLITGISAVFSAFFYLGVSSAITRYYYEYNNYFKKKFISSAILTSYLGAFIQILLAILFSNFFSNFLFDDVKYSYIIILSFINGAFTFINFNHLLILRYEDKPFYFILSTISVFLLSFLLIIFFFKNNFGLLSPFLGLTIGQFFLLIILIILQKNNFVFPSIKFVKEVLIYGIPCAISSLIYMLNEWLDRFLINEFMNQSDVGKYYYGSKIGSLVYVIFVIPFSLIWHQLRMKYFTSPDRDVFYTLTLTYFTFICITIFLVFGLFTKEIIFISSPNDQEYLSTDLVIKLIIVAQILFGLVNILDFGIVLSKKTYLFIISGSLALITNLIGNLFLIKIFGINGSAIVKILSSFTMLYFTFKISSKYYNYIIEYKRLLLLFLISFLLIFFKEIIFFENYIYNLFIQFFLLSLFVIFSIKIFFSKKELKFIYSFFSILK